jgi:hypothetical protein
MDIPATLDTAKFRQLVLQGIESLSGGGGGGASSTNTAVGPDGVTRVPLQVNSDGELKVNVEASINADLTLIENKLDTIIGIETPQSADVAAIKTKLNNGIGVTGTFWQATQPVSGTVSSNTKDGSGTSITSTTVSSKQGLDVNIIAGGGSSVVTNAGTFAVQNTAATPAGTNFIGSVNPDSTGSGSVTTTVPYVVTTTNSGTLAFQSDAAATGNVTIEASVDGTNYTATTYTALTTGNTSSSFNAATATIGQIDTSGFKNIRFRSNTIVGSVGITYNLSSNVSNVMLDNPLPAGSNVIGAVTANAGTNLNTSALALESGGNLATVATKMSDGLQTTKIVNGANTLAVDSAGALTANNAASQVYNYTATGAVAGTPVIISSIDCSQFREISVQIVSAGTGFFLTGQISNDGTNWVSCPFVNQGGTIASSSVATVTFYNYQLLGARFFRIQQTAAQTAGTTTIVAYASQQATPKLYQSVTVSSGFVTPAALVGQGFSSYHTLISAASTNATSVKAVQGSIGTCVLTNTSLTFKYVKFFNLGVAPTVGTSTPVIQFPIAPNSTLDVSMSFAGLRLNSGISYAITGGSALLDNTAVGAGEVLVNLTYV